MVLAGFTAIAKFLGEIVVLLGIQDLNHGVLKGEAFPRLFCGCKGGCSEECDHD
jgi:hypothetical protein